MQNNYDLADLVILKANGRAFCAGGDVVGSFLNLHFKFYFI